MESKATSLPVGGILGETPFLWTIVFEESGAGSLASFGAPPDLASGKLTWAHINLSDMRGRHWIESQNILTEEARELLTGPATPQRLHASGEALWGALIDYSQEFGHLEEEVSTENLTQLRFAVGPGYFITARLRPSRSAAAVQRGVIRGRLFTSAYDLVEAVVDESMEAMDGAIDRLARNLDEVEDRVLDDDIRDERRRLGVLRRALIRAHREIGGALRVVSRFDPKGQSAPAAQAVVQQFAFRLDSCNQEVQAAEQRARLLQDEIVSKLTTETNRQLYVLTILSTLLLPPTLITGVFGMNVGGLPFSEGPSGFIQAILICFVAAFFGWAFMWSVRNLRPSVKERCSFRRHKREAPAPKPEEG